MMKSFVLAFAIAALCACSLRAKDSLAVAEPVNKGGLDAQSIEVLWDILEASVKTDAYDLVSRSALKQMMTEIGLANSSGLVDPTADQIAQIGKLKGVNYLLVCTVGKLGTRLNCVLKLTQCSTGGIAQNRTANLRCRDLDELADKIEPALDKLFSDQKQLKRAALLTPLIKVDGAAPRLASNAYDYIGTCLLQNGISLQNLSNVSDILAKNQLGPLTDIEPALCHKVGTLLEVEFLIQPEITRFLVIHTPVVIAETGAQFSNYSGAVGGSVKVIETKTGRIAALIPFEFAAESKTIGVAVTRNWQPEDFYKYLLYTAISQQVLPGLVTIPGMK